MQVFVRKLVGGVLLCFALFGWSEPLVVVSFNVESGGSDESINARIVEEIAGVDIWGFSEVRKQWKHSLVEAVERARGFDFDAVLGTTGGADRLMIAYNQTRFDLVSSEELDQINQGNHRAPLVVHLRQVADALELLVVVNHLARGNEVLRHEQLPNSTHGRMSKAYQSWHWATTTLIGTSTTANPITTRVTTI